MYRRWLQDCADLRKCIKDADALETVDARWKALRALAGRNHDFPNTVRLDGAIRRLQGGSVDGDTAGLQPIRLAILSTSTTGHLTAGIRVAGLGRGLWLDIYEPAYGQGRQEIADPGSALHGFAPTAVLFASDAYSLFGAGGEDMLADAAQSGELAQSAVDALRGQWRRARDLWGAVVVQQLPFNPLPRLLGENEHRLAGSTVTLVRLFQEKLRLAADEEGIDLIDVESWAVREGLAAWHSTALWHRSKQEVHPTITPLYGDLVARLLAARYGRSAKCLVLDLDNTLWGGVIGDDGVEGIVLGQGSAVGEGHLAFQQYAKQLGRRGIILAVCSKNDDAVARKPFRDHPDMVLRLDDIGCFVANWTDKATNIRRIATELNIGLDAIVFADDNPFERELVRSELPEIIVPELPEDPSDFAPMMASSGYFEGITLTRDDLAKTEQYQSNARRQALQNETTDLDGYLAALDMTLRHSAFDEIGLPRIVQLINKTNQFNLTTRRYSEPDVRRLLDDSRAVTLQLRLIDRFGDNGIIGIIIATLDGATRMLSIETWLMSCRVLGRQVEQASLDVLAQAARAIGAKAIVGEYIPSGRNAMVEGHYARLGFSALPASGAGARWMLVLDEYQPVPTHIRIEHAP